MIRFWLVLMLTFLLAGVSPALASEEDTEKEQTTLSDEDREVAEMLDLLELMELLKELENVSDLEESS